MPVHPKASPGSSFLIPLPPPPRRPWTSRQVGPCKQENYPTLNLCFPRSLPRHPIVFSTHSSAGEPAHDNYRQHIIKSSGKRRRRKPTAEQLPAADKSNDYDKLAYPRVWASSGTSGGWAIFQSICDREFAQTLLAFTSDNPWPAACATPKPGMRVPSCPLQLLHNKYWREYTPLGISDIKLKSYKLFTTEITFIFSSLDMIFLRVFPLRRCGCPHINKPLHHTSGISLISKWSKL